MVGGRKNKKQIFSLPVLVGGHFAATVTGETKGAEMLGSGYYREISRLTCLQRGWKARMRKTLSRTNTLHCKPVVVFLCKSTMRAPLFNSER